MILVYTTSCMNTKMNRDALKFRPSLLFLLIIANLACGFSAATQTSPAPAATPLARPSPTMGLASPISASTESSRYFVEEFNADVTGWTAFVTSGEAGLLDLRVEGGFWVFDLGGKDLHAFALYGSETYHDVRLDVRVVNRGVTAEMVSLICRYSEKDGWYQFDIFNSGIYNIFYFAWDEEKQASPILVNGREARTLTESRFFLREGQVGVGVSSFTRLPVRVDFDWVKISLP